MDEIVCSSRPQAETVLASMAWQPPPPPATTEGRVAALRDAMARFSNSEQHPERRSAVDRAISALDGFPFAEEARTRALARLTGERIEAVADLGFIVPTETLASSLNVGEFELDTIRLEVLEVVRVIGRQEEPTAATQESVARLEGRFDAHPLGHVPPVSLLYQNHDATAALLAATIIARHSGRPRRPALARTTRIATRRTEINQVAVSAGTSVVIDLDRTGLEFGSGPHQCPGQRIAEQIVAGITAAIESADYRIVADEIVHHPDGRPSALPMERSDLSGPA